MIYFASTIKVPNFLTDRLPPILSAKKTSAISRLNKTAEIMKTKFLISPVYLLYKRWSEKLHIHPDPTQACFLKIFTKSSSLLSQPFASLLYDSKS
jgi:hypothetical protein